MLLRHFLKHIELSSDAIYSRLLREKFQGQNLTLEQWHQLLDIIKNSKV